jgi:hypothetical protein
MNIMTRLSIIFVTALFYHMFLYSASIYAADIKVISQTGVQYKLGTGNVKASNIVSAVIEQESWNFQKIKVSYRFEDSSLCPLTVKKAIIRAESAIYNLPELYSSSSALIDLHAPVYPPPVPHPHLGGPSNPTYINQVEAWAKSLPSVNIEVKYNGLRPSTTTHLQITMHCATQIVQTGVSTLVKAGKLLDDDILNVRKIWADVWAAPYGGDSDADGILDLAEDYYANKYAPQVLMDSAETCFPSSVGWYFERVSMGFHHNKIPCISDCRDIASKVDNDLHSVKHTGKARLAWRDHHPVSCAHEGDTFRASDDSKDSFYLEHKDGSVKQGESSPTSVPVYVHVRSKGTNQPTDDYMIQYWFFYPYNLAEKHINHEGDWEHVTLTLDYKSSLKNVYFARHGLAGEYVNRDNLHFADQAKIHPIVYSASGTHASYPKPGKYDVTVTLPYIQLDYTFQDKADGNGKRWDTWNYLVNIGEKAWPRNNNDWIKYGGLWGKIGNLDDVNLTSNTSGPQGPAFKEGFNKDDE